MAHTVLLIDYDPRSIGRIRQLLQGYGARLVLARDGASGLDEYHREKPDLTLTQDLIPNMHGFEVCRAIKRSDGGADHPVVLLCGRHSHSTLVDTGCDAYVEKPFDDDDLLDVLNRLLPGGLRRPESRVASTDADPPPAARAPQSDAGPVSGSQSLEVEIDGRLDDVLRALDAPATAGSSVADHLAHSPLVRAERAETLRRDG